MIVVTDRRVLDSQLQNTIYQFEHKSGVVQRIDKDSQQLADAIGGGANIIITTLQKFSFIVEKVGSLPNRNYAVIIDEAHSSQGGEASKKMKQVLGNANALEESGDGSSKAQEPYPGPAEEEDDEGIDSQDIVTDYIEQSAANRGPQSKLVLFGLHCNAKI